MLAKAKVSAQGNISHPLCPPAALPLWGAAGREEKKAVRAGLVVHTCGPSTWETEAGQSL